MKYNTLVLTLLLIFTAGCDDYEYVPSGTDPLLPAYTERGFNTSGAYVDGRPHTSIGTEALLEFRPGNSLVPASILITVAVGSYRVIFSLGVNALSQPINIQNLEGTTWELDGVFANAGVMGGRNNPGFCTSTSGRLYIRNIGGDQTIISGTFGIDLPDDCFVQEITNGRFDLKIERVN